MALSYVLPVLLFLLLWLPEIAHYYVPNETISPEMLESGRHMPSNAVFDELQKYRFFEHSWQDDRQLVLVAEKLLVGSAEIPGFQPTTIQMPFDPRDIDRGSSSWQLEFSGLLVPQLFLDAYQLTGREDFFIAARDVILGWANYERHAWLPKGFLWNDHAIAARVSVLTQFWRIYRHHPTYRPEVANVVWQFAARSGELLAKRELFNFSTNHGVMQNLGLWHICVGFPTLPHVPHYTRIAFERLDLQLGFYLDDEGVILEHSAAYQSFGLHLMSLALRYMSLLDQPIPAAWVQKYEAARKFYAELRRPDGSLPLFGDTHDTRNDRGPLVGTLNGEDHVGPLHYVNNWTPLEEFTTYPLSGYAIQWSSLSQWPDPSKLAQNVLLWSNFPGHGHKHADELSVLFWADGQNWWTNLGSWSDGVAGANEAQCWAGSNAPHLFEEDCRSVRTSKLIYVGRSRDVTALEVERIGPKQYSVRRQIVRLDPNVWIVIDNTTGDEGQRTLTYWTTAPKVRMERQRASDHYSLVATGSALRLTAFFLGPNEMTVNLLRGSLYPFAGWGVENGVTLPASTLVIEEPATSSWAAAVWVLSGEVGPTPTEPFASPPRLMDWKDHKNWRMFLPLKSGTREITRVQDTLWLRDGSQRPPAGLTLVEPADLTLKVKMLREKYDSATKQYKQFKDLLPYRYRATYLLVFILSVQVVLMTSWARGKNNLRVWLLSLSGWLILGFWLFAFYLRA